MQSSGPLARPPLLLCWGHRFLDAFPLPAPCKELLGLRHRRGSGHEPLHSSSVEWG